MQVTSQSDVVLPDFKKRRNSIDSAISIRSSQDSRIVILKAEKNIFQKQQFVQVWSQPQENETYVPLQEVTTNEPDWSPMAVWNPTTQTWSLPPTMLPTNSSAIPIKITRKNYL